MEKKRSISGPKQRLGSAGATPKSKSKGNSADASASKFGTGGKTPTQSTGPHYRSLEKGISKPGTSSRFQTPQTKTKSSLDGSSSRPCREHSFLTDVADVRQMEQGLMQLLNDFHSGKLQAFGQECSFEKMDQIREKQETLARLHFELDSNQDMKNMDSQESRQEANKNLNKLMDNLQELCISIQNLQNEQSSSAQSTLKSDKGKMLHP